jgi:hypothetical protein
MSIYYNLTMTPSNTESIDRNLEIEHFNNGDILQKQSDYSVGVKRFKIPISNVDLYRIYENHQTIGTLMIGETHTNEKFLTQQPFDLYDVSSWNLNNVDTQQTELPHTKTTVKGRYLPIESHDEYAVSLTRANTLSFNESNLNPIPTKTSVAATYTNLESNSTWYTVAQHTATRGTNLKFLQYKFGINSWRPKVGSAGENKHKFSDFQFRMVVGSGTDIINVYLGGGIYPNIKSAGDWNGMGFYAFGVGDTTQNSLSFANYGRVSYRKAMYNTRGWGLGGDVTERIFCPDSYEDLDILFREYSDKFISFQVRDMANLGAGADNQTEWSVNFEIFERVMDGWDSGEEQDGVRNIETNYCPRFVFNEDSQKMEYLAQSDSLANNNVWINSGVIASTNFLTTPVSTNISDTAYLNIFQTYVYHDTNGRGNETNGGIVQFKTTTDPITKLTIDELDITITSYAEPFKSLFKRKFISGIEILSNRLAIEGEMGGETGNQKKKIVTDFELDPSTVEQDYLIYTPQGNSVRYYPLRSGQPLNAVDVRVNYIDIFGNSRRLTINNNMYASVKLEFRPNNMIQYY